LLHDFGFWIVDVGLRDWKQRSFMVAIHGFWAVSIGQDMMDKADMIHRTKSLALRIVRLVAPLPRNRIGDVLGRQLLRSGTSVGANYREATRASSKRHFISYVEIAAREADETLYWLELLSESGTVRPELLRDLMSECNELTAILTTTGRTAKQRQ